MRGKEEGGRERNEESFCKSGVLYRSKGMMGRGFKELDSAYLSTLGM